ncbi:MAG: VWA domain-containing protein [Acidobacteriaceae bacterium]
MRRLTEQSSRALAVVLIAAASAAAQAGPGRAGTPEETGPSAAGANDAAEGLMHLDVVVTDAAGRAVTGLGAGDFTVLDNGRPEAIRSFAASRREDAVRVILVLDTLQIPDALARAERLAAIAFLRENGGHLAQPTTVFSLTAAGLWMVADLSRDGKKLADDVEHDRETGLVRGFPEALARAAVIQLPASLEALQALGQIATAERRVPGRKVLLWLGPGAGMGSDAYAAGASPKSDTFYTICWFSILLRDARLTLDSFSAGQTNPSQQYRAYLHGTTRDHADPMYLSREVLAEESGGQVIDRSFDLVEALNQCVREAGTYYALSFDPAPAAYEEEYHTIQVKVSRPGLTARTTTGYYGEPYDSDELRLGVRRVTVAAMDVLMATLQAEPDGAAAEELGELRLTERASDATAARWTAELRGKKARAALEGLTDEAEFLPLPAGKAPGDLAPDAMAQWAILARAHTYLKDTIPNLPNFFARRTTVHYEESAQYKEASLRVDYRPLHVVETTRETVVYRHGAEIVESGGRGHEGMRPWLTTYGTFGPVLDMVRDVLASGVMWSRWDEEAGRKAAVFRYAIPLAASHYQVSGCCRPDGDGQTGFQRYVGYHGEIAIDAASGAILRIEADADLARGVPLDEGNLVVRYGPVEIGGKTYVCPLRSVSLWRSLSESTLRDWDEKFLTWGPYESMVNDIRYSDYHIFRAKVRILPAGEP